MAEKIALVGIGKIARDQHIPAIAENPDWDLAATVSRNASVEGVQNYRDLDAMLAARPDINVVSLAIPPQPRFDYASAALRAGREAEAKTVAVILPDGGERYLSESFWEAR